MVRSQDGSVAELDKNGKIIDFCYTHVAYTHTMPVQIRASECLGTNTRVTHQSVTEVWLGLLSATHLHDVCKRLFQDLVAIKVLCHELFSPTHSGSINRAHSSECGRDRGQQ